MSQPALQGKIAIATGASSGIGAASAELLAEAGALVVMGARRLPRLEQLRRRIEQRGGHAEALELDVADAASCHGFARQTLERHQRVDVLINNAGLARGFEPVAEATEADWREMLEANVLGLMRITQAFLPAMIARGAGDIVQLSSVAALQPYPRGAAYCASKAAVEAFAQSLRLELTGTQIRQLVIEPGMVETEFSDVRFHGDAERAKQVYQGVQPLSARDVAECILFALTRPPHVSVQTMLLMPTAQASATVVHRK